MLQESKHAIFRIPREALCDGLMRTQDPSRLAVPHTQAFPCALATLPGALCMAGEAAAWGVRRFDHLWWILSRCFLINPKETWLIPVADTPVPPLFLPYFKWKPLINFYYWQHKGLFHSLIFENKRSRICIRFAIYCCFMNSYDFCKQEVSYRNGTLKKK